MTEDTTQDSSDAALMGDPDGMSLAFTGDVWHWRGPSPYYFVTVPDEECLHLRGVSPGVTYGWGMIPVRAQIGGTAWETSLFPKDGLYVVPVKDVVRRAEGIEEGDVVTVQLIVTGRR